MKRTLIITVAVAVPVFLATRAIFPLPEHGPQPEGVQLPLFMIIGAFEALALGLAVAILLSAPRLIARLSPADRGPAWILALAATWFLGNWWVHDNLHMTVGENLNGLLALEYGFHVTLILAGASAVAAMARLAHTHRAQPQPVNASQTTSAAH